MIDWRQVALFDVVAGTGFVDATGKIDAEPVDHVARPATAIALQFQALLGGENAAVSRALDMQQEIAFLAEQAKAVANFPRYPQGGVRARLCRCPLRRQCRQRSGKQHARDYATKATSDHDAFDVTVGAEIRELAKTG